MNLAFSSTFPKPPPHVLDPKIFQSAGISRVAFLRHGNTAPQPRGGIDFDRQLTDLGREQAESAGSSYGIDLLPHYSVALSSSAPRCLDTANIFLQASKTNDFVAIKAAQSLYDGTMQPAGSALFKKIGYAPLRRYYENQDENDRITAHRVLAPYALTALGAITDVASSSLDRDHQPHKESTLLLFAHAVYLPAAALGLAAAAGCKDGDLDIVLDTNTKEAEGYLVDLEGAKTSLLCRPESS